MHIFFEKVFFEKVFFEKGITCAQLPDRKNY